MERKNHLENQKPIAAKPDGNFEVNRRENVSISNLFDDVISVHIGLRS